MTNMSFCSTYDSISIKVANATIAV